MLENVRFEPGETKNDPELAEALRRARPTSTSTTRSAPRTARTRRPTASPQLLPARRRAAAPARGRDAHRHPRRTRSARSSRSSAARRSPTRSACWRRFLAARRHGPDRRRDVLPVLQGPGPRRRRRRCARRRASSPPARVLDGGSEQAASCPTDLVARPRVLRRHRGAGAIDGVDVPDGWMGLDVGPETAAAYAEVDRRRRHASSGTGPMGAFELEPFAAGTRAVAEAVARRAGHDRRRRRRLAPRRSREFGLADQVDPPLHRRRRVTGAHRGQDPPGRGGTR